jgi:DNA polymerase I-like protein with 3'-5' exonuclease and polymerase domains
VVTRPERIFSIVLGIYQQTAPEYIGVTDEEVQNAISKYLQDIPHKEFYGTTVSFFDHASAYFDKINTIITLHQYLID